MTQFSDDAIERILTAAVQRKGGAVSIVDVISLSSLYNNVYGQPSCNPSAPSAAIQSVQDSGDDDATAALDEKDTHGNTAAVSPSTSWWVTAATLVWGASMSVWCKFVVAMIGLAAVLGRAQTCVFTAFKDRHESDADDEHGHRDGDEDDAVTAKMLHFLVSLLRAKAHERDAHTDTVNGHSRSSTAQTGFESVLLAWPVVRVDQGTSPRVLSLYADVSVVVDSIVAAKEARFGGACSATVVSADPGAWV